MSDLHQIHIHIVFTTANDASDDLLSSLELSAEQRYCELWAHCRNPYCYKHGCLNALCEQGKKVQS